MSDRLEEIIEKAAGDADFRARLLEDPQRALASYGLSEDEKEQIVSALSEKFEGVLDQRLSKRRMGKFGSLSGPMGIDGAVE